MKTKLFRFKHEVNGLAVEIIPETEAEHVVLDALWEWGKMEIVSSSKNPIGKGYVVVAFKSGLSSNKEKIKNEDDRTNIVG